MIYICQNTLASTHKENTHTEILLVIHTNSIMTLTIKILPHSETNIQPHAIYFTGNSDTINKIYHVTYQTIEYNDNGMFTTKLVNDTPIEIFIDNSATPSILPLCTYNKFPILHTYPKTESNTLYIQEEV